MTIKHWLRNGFRSGGVLCGAVLTMSLVFVFRRISGELPRDCGQIRWRAARGHL